MGGADPGATGFTMASFEQQVPLARINDAVTRILKLKFELGVFDHPYGDPVNGPYRFHQPELRRSWPTRRRASRTRC